MKRSIILIPIVINLGPIIILYCAKKISWQGWTEKKVLAKLVADEKAVGPILEFLKTTEIGSREGGEGKRARVGEAK